MGRRKSESNVFVIVGDTAYIHLVGKHGVGKVAITDLWSFKKYNLDTYSWKCNKNLYVYTTIEGKMVFLHGLILGNTDPKLMVDHINGSEGEKTLDNRRSNLRPCTNRENQLNAKIRIDNKVGYKNVTLLNGKYRCMIKVHSIKEFFGHFDKPEQAALAYNIAMKFISEIYQPNVIPEAALTNDEIEHVHKTVNKRFEKIRVKYDIKKIAVNIDSLSFAKAQKDRLIDKII
ncbi:hypothetical protein V7139_18945 [Neobacillus drentensis]|uniref:hypothetical protein n=1 Tax=Neobacillus drentensis TaxID=220684 RepID=UPI003003171B